MRICLNLTGLRRKSRNPRLLHRAQQLIWEIRPFVAFYIYWYHCNAVTACFSSRVLGDVAVSRLGPLRVISAGSPLKNRNDSGRCVSITVVHCGTLIKARHGQVAAYSLYDRAPFCSSPASTARSLLTSLYLSLQVSRRSARYVTQERQVYIVYTDGKLRTAKKINPSSCYCGARLACAFTAVT